MKSRQIPILILTIVTSVFLLASCTPPAIKKAHNVVVSPQIFLKYNTSSGELEILTDGDKRCTIVAPGCVKVAIKDTAVIYFNLQQRNTWRLTNITICKINGGVQDCNLSDIDRAQFAVSDKSGSPKYYPDNLGVIDLTQISPDLGDFYLTNYNYVKQNYYYSITACKGTSTECEVADPILENEGKIPSII